MNKRLDWVANTNIYEVNLRQYSEEGSFNAFAKELPRLKDMGIETLWFMPLTPISVKNRKGTMGSYYACSDFKSINPEFGTIENFRDLINLAHIMEFNVVIDWVANHTGWDHIWTKQHPDYYKFDEGTRDFKMASGMEDIIELNFENPELSKEMIDAMKWWVDEFDIDGFRCDLAFWVKLEFWQKARPQLDSIKPLFWLGEFDEMEKPEYGEVFDGSYTWKWMHETEQYYKNNRNLAELIQVLKHYDDLGPQCLRAWFTSNHDENSWNGTEFEKYGVLARALAVFSITWDGIPLIYSGQEEPNKKRLAFFDKDLIEWSGEYEQHGFYKELLSLKKFHPALRTGDAAVKTIILKHNEPEKVLAYQRVAETETLTVLLSLSMEDIQLNINDERAKLSEENCLHELKGGGYVIIA